MEESIRQEPRPSSFILFKDYHTHNSQGRPFLRAQTTVEAIIALIATYYVFDLKYDEKVQNALLFLQSFVFWRKEQGNGLLCCRPLLLNIRGENFPQEEQEKAHLVIFLILISYNFLLICMITRTTPNRKL